MMHAAPWACQPGNLLRMKIFCRCSTHGAITTGAAGNATADGLRWGRQDGQMMTMTMTTPRGDDVSGKWQDFSIALRYAIVRDSADSCDS